jgi:hypothetical protein
VASLVRFATAANLPSSLNSKPPAYSSPAKPSRLDCAVHHGRSHRESTSRIDHRYNFPAGFRGRDQMELRHGPLALRFPCLGQRLPALTLRGSQVDRVARRMTKGPPRHPEPEVRPTLESCRGWFKPPGSKGTDIRSDERPLPNRYGDCNC